jgi:hypothetical protein
VLVVLVLVLLLLAPCLLLLAPCAPEKRRRGTLAFFHVWTCGRVWLLWGLQVYRVLLL